MLAAVVAVVLLQKVQARVVNLMNQLVKIAIIILNYVFMRTLIRISMALILMTGIAVSGCAQNTAQEKKQAPATAQKSDEVKYKVTFVELGSVRCIPCQKMQPVMKSVEEKYAGQVKVVFHDVWTPDGEPFAKKYRIQSIPTQVFLDENGKEFARHVGYFPEEELVKVLKQKGVK